LETRTLLDTHAIIWFYQKDLEKFSSKVLTMVQKDDLLMSPITFLELDFLYEIGRIKQRSQHFFETLRKEMNVQVAPGDFLEVVQNAHHMSWTRDPFDRLLVAHADFLNARLLTKDRLLRKHYSKSLW